MKLHKELLTLSLALTILMLPCLCSAKMTVSLDTDKDNYFIGDTITFTCKVIIADSESGCCNLDIASLEIKDGTTQVCELATDQGNYDQGYGNCNLVMKVTETHPSDCDSYGGDNTIEYMWIYWTIPQEWDLKESTATITAIACGTSKTKKTKFNILTNTTSSNDDVEVINQTTGETDNGYGEVDITLENNNTNTQNTTIAIPIPGTDETINLTIEVPGNGTRHIVAIENDLIFSPGEAVINDTDYNPRDNKLTLELCGEGIQEILLYTGKHKKPKSITLNGEMITNWTYNPQTKTVTFHAQLTCPAEIVVTWRIIKDRSGGDGGGVPAPIIIKPSCSDGIRNQGEEEVDCGGPCKPCSSCSDGVRNQGEGGVDCGGPCKPCPSCSDGVRNQGEEGVDCGGPCKPCPSCSDGIRNQGEEEVDCGGPCKACEVTTTTRKPAVTTTLAAIPTSTTTIPPTPGIPLGMREGAIILIGMLLILITARLKIVSATKKRKKEGGKIKTDLNAIKGIVTEIKKKRRIYLDTSILSFYFADDAPKERDLTRELFRAIGEGRFKAFISDRVLKEIEKIPNPKRNQIKNLIAGFNLPQLKLDKAADDLAMRYIENKIIPSRYEADALHIAISVINQLDVIVSWNFKHIVKLKSIIGVNKINKQLGHKEIILCSPREMLEK